MIDLNGTGQLNGYPIKPMCSVLVNEWAFYGPYTTLPTIYTFHEMANSTYPLL